MEILTILYRSDLPPQRIDELFRQRAGRYLEVEGLVEKLYVREPSTGRVGGIYLFDTPEHLETFRRSELARSISDAYRFAEAPTSQVLDVVMSLRGLAEGRRG